MRNMKTFGSLLEGLHSTQKGIPAVVMTNNSFLRDTVRGLVSSTLVDADISIENVSEAVKEYEALYNNKLENADQFCSLDTIANAFAAKLHTGVETLRKVKDNVTELVETVNNRVVTRLAEDAFLSAFYNIDKHPTMKEVEWNKLDNINELGVIIKLHDTINLGLEAPVTNEIISLLLNRTPYTDDKSELTSITIPEEKTTKIVNALAAQVKGYSRDYIAGAFQNILELDTHRCIQATNKLKSFANGKDAAEINKMLSLADSYNQILPLMNKNVLDLAESTMVELNKHIDAIQYITNMTIYLCSHYRNTIWKNSVIVPGTLYNPDVMDEYEKQGGNMTQLCHHTNEYHPDGKIPTHGISGQYVIDRAKALSPKIEQRIAVDSQKAEQLKKEITRGEFIYAGVEWLDAHKQYYSPSFYSNDLSKFAAAVYDNNINAPMTNMFYDLIIQSCYRETIVPEIYKRLTNAYLKHASSSESISQEVCDQIEAAVYADMVSEYLVEQNILIV